MRNAVRSSGLIVPLAYFVLSIPATAQDVVSITTPETANKMTQDFIAALEQSRVGEVAVRVERDPPRVEGRYVFGETSTSTVHELANGRVTHLVPQHPSPNHPVTVTPEPGTVMLLATGLVSLAGIAWHRRRRGLLDGAKPG